MEDPPLEILEYLVPRIREQSKKETTDESEQCSNESDKETDEAEKDNKDESEESSDESEQESFGAEQEWKSDLEDCSLAEIEKVMASIKKGMDKLASKLEVVQKIHAQKLNSVS